MASFFIRVHDTAVNLTENKFIEYLAERSNVLVCVEHPPDEGCSRTHCHMFCEGCSVKYDSINNKLSTLGYKGNTAKSIKETYEDASKNNIRVDIGCVVYMSKGIYEPSFLKGMDEAKYNELRSLWIDYKSPEQKKKNEKEKKEKKKNEKEIFEHILLKLETEPYKCKCYLCTPEPYCNTQTIFEVNPRLWDPTDAHENTKHAMSVIRDTYFKYGTYDERKMMRVMYMLINHRDIHANSVNRMEKFLFQ